MTPHLEEWLGKRNALLLFDSGLLDTLPVGTFEGLSLIHRALFENVFDFAGNIRKVNIAKGNFRFASALYLEDALRSIDKYRKVRSMKSSASMWK